MATVLKNLGLASGLPDPCVGQYLQSFNHLAHGGRGEAVFTPERGKAMRFATVQEAMAYWQQVHPLIPTRTDGRPNKPLTAFSVELETVPDA